MNGRCCLFSAQFKVFFLIQRLHNRRKSHAFHVLHYPNDFFRVKLVFLLQFPYHNYQLVIHHTMDAGPNASALISLQVIINVLFQTDLFFVHRSFLYLAMIHAINFSRSVSHWVAPSLNDRIRYFSIKKRFTWTKWPVIVWCRPCTCTLYIFLFFFLLFLKSMDGHPYHPWIPWILNIDRRFSSVPNQNTTNDGINSNIGLIESMPVRFINILNRCTLHHWNFVAPIRNTNSQY